MPACLKTIADLVFDLLQHPVCFFEYQMADFSQVGAGQRTLVGALLQGADHSCQGRFDVQQRSGNIHQHRIVRHPLTLSQTLQHQHLVDDHPTRLAEAEHGQRVSDLPQRR
ncbi:hypothetical protein D3C81_720390 [compost metagenome]